jgi:hypothetical protein
VAGTEAGAPDSAVRKAPAEVDEAVLISALVSLWSSDTRSTLRDVSGALSVAGS